MFICNAFSLQMIEDFPCSVDFAEIPSIEGMDLQSAIGHADTAAVLGFPMNRVNVKLHKGDQIIIAQLQGGRLPEGSTELPDGFSFKFLLASVN